MLPRLDLNQQPCDFSMHACQRLPLLGGTARDLRGKAGAPVERGR